MAPAARDLPRPLVLSAVVVWLALVCLGLAYLVRYSAKPGAASTVAAGRWPEATRVSRATALPTLVQFIHPRCACSRASLAELERLMARLRERVEARVVIVRPRGGEGDWGVAQVERRVQRIPATEAVIDLDGSESARFGAATSGMTLLFGPNGRRLFAGGITPARGHEGSSLGQARIVALLAGDRPDRPDSPVFGCSLHGY